MICVDSAPGGNVPGDMPRNSVDLNNTTLDVPLEEGACDTYAEAGDNYCDTCRSACVLREQNGRNRKIQARYEGFVFLKRVNGYSPVVRHILSRCGPDEGRAVPILNLNGHIFYNERRHSCGDVLDGGAGAGSAVPADGITQVPTSQSAPTTRSLSTVSSSDYYSRGGSVVPEKLVNLPRSECHTFATVNRNCGVLLMNNNAPLPNTRKGRKSSGRLMGANHLGSRLPAKQYRSQENLCGGAGGRRVKPADTAHIPLNNHRLVRPSTAHLNHLLSRSEGSIHNITSTRVGEVGVEASQDGGVSGIRAGVGELAKFPKKLFNKFSDEVGQIMFSLERWREEYIVLTNSVIAIKNHVKGALEMLIPYSQIEDIEVVFPYGHHHCLLVTSRRQSIFLQTSTAYLRDQWFHTILWKKNEHRCRSLLKNAKRPEVLLKELKNLVTLSLLTPLYDHSVCQVPLEIASSILTRCEGLLSQHTNEVIIALAPLMENNKPSPEICTFLSCHCSGNPRSRLVIDMFTPVVKQILKRNVDFGKYPPVCRFVQDYFKALNSQNEGGLVVSQFVREMHGPSGNCPHLRVLPNLVSVAISAIGLIVQLPSNASNGSKLNTVRSNESDMHLECFISLLDTICDYDDWRPGLAQLLQPVPFPSVAFMEESFIKKILPVITRIGTDQRCQVHQMVVSGHESKEGWLQILCPTSLAPCDKGDAWTAMLRVLLTCCYRRKKFLEMLLKSLGSCMTLALRDNDTAQDILCLMMEWQLVNSSEKAMQIVTTLQSTPSGKKKYQALCERQTHLQELQQKGGPFELSLPSRSTDSDVIRLLSSGPFGNLISLSLAFSRVTSACADQLIKFPTLRYLNLWSTQFGDNGLHQICEHLHNLEMLNLCETAVTDEGLCALVSLKKLRRLNLNSTLLSHKTFDLLKESLPSLQHVDVRYTDAWNADLEYSDTWTW